MPRTTMEKLKSERRQLRRGFTKTYNEVSGLLTKDALTNDDISLLKSTAGALHDQFQECITLEKELRAVVLEEIKDEKELDTFFDEVTDVTNTNRGKFNKITFFLAELEKKNAKPPVSQTQSIARAATLRSKLPDLQLSTFDGQITEWNGFWERFQSQVGSLQDLPQSSKFTYLVGQLRGEALKTVQGIIPSEQNYSVLETTLKENFGKPRRIIRAHVLNILKLPKPTQSASSIRNFYNSLMGDIRSLQALKIDVPACAPFIIPIIEDKLPGKVRGSIGDSGKGVEFDLKSFTDSFKDFISLEEQPQTSPFQTPQYPSPRYDSCEPSITSTLSTNIQTRCQLCKGSHASSQCTMSANEKSAAVIRLKLCLNCLHPGHRVSACTAKGRCSKCKGKHHSSIHGIRVHSFSSNSVSQRSAPISSQLSPRASVHAAIVTHDAHNVASVTETSPSAESMSQSVTTNCAPLLNTSAINLLSNAPLPVDIKPSYDESNITRSTNFVDSAIDNSSSTEEKTSLSAPNHVILLKTAKAAVVLNDKTVIANIFFDEGSQRSYIRAGFANELGLKPESYELLSVSSFGGNVTKQNYPVTTIGLDTPSGIELVKVLVSDEIVQPLNQSGCSILKTNPRFHDFKFANDFNGDSFEVDILIGADAAYRFLGAIDTRVNDMFIQTSKFGSIVSGPLPATKPSIANHAKLQEVPTFHTSATQSNNGSDSTSPGPFPSSFSITNVIDNIELSIQFERLLQSQSVNYDHEKQTANQFINNYQQQIEFRDGQYFAPLPWKADHPPLPSNLELCKRRLTQVTSRLNKLGLMKQYCKVMEEHLTKGYIEELSELKQP